MYHEIMEEQAKLEVALSLLKKRGKAFAEAERDYTIALRSEIMKLRDEGHPVTIIIQLAKGNSNVAQLRTQRTINETLYRSSLEAINVLKLKIRIMEAQYDREWGNS